MEFSLPEVEVAVAFEAAAVAGLVTFLPDVAALAGAETGAVALPKEELAGAEAEEVILPDLGAERAGPEEEDPPDSEDDPPDADEDPPEPDEEDSPDLDEDPPDPDEDDAGWGRGMEAGKIVSGPLLGAGTGVATGALVAPDGEDFLLSSSPPAAVVVVVAVSDERPYALWDLDEDDELSSPPLPVELLSSSGLLPFAMESRRFRNNGLSCC